MNERADAPWVEPQSALLLGQTAARPTGLAHGIMPVSARAAAD